MIPEPALSSSQKRKGTEVNGRGGTGEETRAAASQEPIGSLFLGSSSHHVYSPLGWVLLDSENNGAVRFLAETGLLAHRNGSGL